MILSLKYGHLNVYDSEESIIILSVTHVHVIYIYIYRYINKSTYNIFTFRGVNRLTRKLPCLEAFLSLSWSISLSKCKIVLGTNPPLIAGRFRSYNLHFSYCLTSERINFAAFCEFVRITELNCFPPGLFIQLWALKIYVVQKRTMFVVEVFSW